MNGHRDFSQNKYAHLDHLSTEALYALLQADIESTTDDDDEMIFCILEILERREMETPTGRLSDVDQAWKMFQEHYHTEEGDGLELYPCCDGSEGARDFESPKPAVPARRSVRSARILRNLVAAAVILLASLVVAQAAGFDVFGAIGRWTEEQFQFSLPSTSGTRPENSYPSMELSHPYYETITEALREFGVSEALAPTWFPEGFAAETLTTYSGRAGDQVYGMFKNEEDLYFDFSIYRENDASTLETIFFEKDATPVELHTSRGRTFYIMSNIDSIGAVWSDGQSILVSVSGNISKAEIIRMIDSMGG